MLFKQKNNNEEKLNNVLRAENVVVNDFPEIKKVGPKKKTLFSKMIISLLIVALVSVIFFAVFMFFTFNSKNKDTNPENTKKIELNINASNIDVDGRISYEIDIKNTEEFNIEKANLKVRLPKEFIFIETDNSPIETTKNYISWTFSNITIGSSVKIKLDGIILGKVSNIVILTADLNYLFDKISTPFFMTNNYEALITRPIVDIVIEKPLNIQTNEEFKYRIKIKNNSDRVLNNVGFKFSYKDYFQITKKSEEPAKENKDESLLYLFNLNKNLNSGIDASDDAYYDKIIEISGILKGESLNSIDFNMQLGIVEDVGDLENISYLIEKNDNFNLSNSGFSFMFNQNLPFETINDYKTVVIKNINDLYNISFKYKKEGTVNNFKDVRISFELLGDDLVDMNSLKSNIKPIVTTNKQGDIVNNLLEWNKDNVENLKNISDKENEIKFSFNLNKNIITSFARSSIVSLSVYGLNDRDEEVLLYKFPSFKIAVDSLLSVDGKIKYFDENSNQVGFGPNPPVVGQETKYRVDFRINNKYNDLANVVLTAKMFDNTTYIEDYFVDRGDDLRYDNSTKIVNWNIGDIGKNDNVFGYFYVYFKPGTNLAEKTQKIIDNIEIKYDDSVLGNNIVRNFESIESQKIEK